MARFIGDGFTASVVRSGTDEVREAVERVEVGPLSFGLAVGAVRHLTWRGHELLRAIEFVVRDENWGTYRPELQLRERSESADGVRFGLAGTVAGGALSFGLSIAAHASGRLECRATAEARQDFRTNRTGFVVLHPIEGVAGAPVTIEHTDGSVEHGRFPLHISPGQPFFDIAAISHAPAAGLRVTCRFVGEVFEMEDQRNWTDASFKTYCRPLALPFPYTLGAGERVGQAVAVTIDGDAPARPARSQPTIRIGETAGEGVPAFALAFEPGFEPPAHAEQLLAELGATSLLARIDLRSDPNAAWTLAARTAQAAGLPLELEIVTPDSGDLNRLLADLASLAARTPVTLHSAMALPASYLKSHQPTGPWPQGITPEQAQVAARRAWPGIAIGAGMLTNFTEFNRRPPQPPFDFATHATCAIVHAADDLSVMETLEALPHVFASARALIGRAGYRLGLVAIGARSNPYGAKTADNPEQRRLPMAHVDPRQRGLFAAAFAMGAVAATAGYGIERMALAAPSGPFGCIYRPAAWPQPGFDRLAKVHRLCVYPLFHVLRWLGEGSGRRRLVCEVDEPRRVAAVAWDDGREKVLLLANLCDVSQTVALPGLRGRAQILDETTALTAIADPNWSCRAPEDAFADALALAPYAVARLRCGTSA
jgi:hypothetical protein